MESAHASINTPVNRWIAVTSCAAVIACRGARNRPETDARSPTAGTVYEYSATIPGYQPGSTFRMRGSLTIVADSLFVDPAAACQIHRRSQGSVTAYCGASLSSDARNMRSGRWVTMVRVPRQRTVCVQYEPADPSWLRRCSRVLPEICPVR